MAGADLSTLSNILKEYYLGPVAEQLNNEVLLLSRLETKSEDLVGKRAYIPVHHGRSSGVGARAEGAALPSAGKQDYDKAVYDLKYLYGRVEVTGPSMAKTKNEAGAFLQALKSELDGIRNDLKKDLARQVYGDGTAAIGTVVTSATNSTTVAVIGSEPIRKGQFYANMALNVVDASTGVIGGTVTPTEYTVSAVNVSAGTVTVTPALAAAFAAGDYLVRAGVGLTDVTSEGEVNRLSDEIDGIQRIIPTAANTFGGINAQNKSWWDVQRTDLTVSSNPKLLGLDDIQKALNLARIAGGMPTSIITSLGVQRSFFELLNQDVMYVNPESLNYASGFKTLSYNGLPMIADIDAPYGKMYIMDESTIKVFSDQDWHFLDADGQTLRQVSGYDKFEAIMARYMNLGATRRNNQVVITGIAVGADDSADQGF
jgi:hypothetical protein